LITKKEQVMKRVFFICIIILLITSAYGYTQMGPGMMNWGYDMGWGWSIIMIAFWIAVIVGIIFLIRWIVVSTDRRHETKTGDSALEILRQRYSRGEISKEEFEEKKKDLGV
jgi:putative membrane protein